MNTWFIDIQGSYPPDKPQVLLIDLVDDATGEIKQGYFTISMLASLLERKEEG